MFLNPREGDESIAVASLLSSEQRLLDAIRNLGHEMEGETTKEQAQEDPSDDPPLDEIRHLVHDL